MPQVVDYLHELHPGVCACSRRSFFDDIRFSMKNVRSSKNPIPDGFEIVLEAAYEIEAEQNGVKPPQGVCHNDLVPQHSVLNAGALKLVDFAYTGLRLIVAE